MSSFRPQALALALALCLAGHVSAKPTPPRSMPAGHAKMVRAATHEKPAEFGQFLLRVHSEDGKARNVKKELEKISHGPVHYVPHDTYIVTLEPDQLEQVRGLAGVAEVYKVPKEMKTRATHRAFDRKPKTLSKDSMPVETSIHATLAISKGTAEKRKLDVSEWVKTIKEKTGADVKIKWASSNAVNVQAPTTLAHEVMGVLQDIEVVHQASIEPSMKLMSKSSGTTSEDKASAELRNRWAGNLVQSGNANMSTLWDAGLDGEGQVIGCGDTGIDVDSCFFFDMQPLGTCKGEGFIPGCNSPSHRKIVTYRTVSGAEFGDDDPVGHGTHVAGTISGLSSDPAYVEYDGVAPMARLAFDDIGVETTDSLWLPASWEETLYPHAYMHGAKIHTNSWGDSLPLYTAESYSNDAFSATHDDFLLLFAAGNNGPWPISGSSQSAAKNVVSVGAGENHPDSYPDGGVGKSVDNVAIFSSKGPTADGRFKPTVVAPGENIASADSDGAAYSFQCSAGMMAALETLGGTSMATPACAGGAALIRQYFDKGYYGTGAPNNASAFMPSAALVTAVLIHSGKPMSYYDPYTGELLPAPPTLPHSSQGFGRVDLDSVLYLGAQSPFRLFVQDRVMVDPDQTACFGFMVAGGQQFKASLAWTDPPASPYSAFFRSLIQDLDLVVVSPSGAVMRGNHLDGGVRDRRNNQEQVTVPMAEPGLYSVFIVATDLPFGPQAFSLVVTGDATDGQTCAAPGPPCPNGCGDGMCSFGQCVCEGEGTGPDCSGMPLVEPWCKEEVVATLSGIWMEGASVPVDGPMAVTFKSDAHVGDDGMRALWIGFSAWFTSIPEPSVVSRCNGPGRNPILLRQSDGMIGTGGWYENDATCHWWIRPNRNPSRVVSLMFLEMDLEAGFDFVHVRECHNMRCTQTTLIGSYTGTDIPDTIVSSRVPVLVTFESDGSETRGGFSMAFTKGESRDVECVPGEVVTVPPTTPFGQFKLPMVNGTYAPNLDCAFVLDSPQGALLSVPRMGTEFSVDVLEVSRVQRGCVGSPPPP
eukprot:CAMPEP_0202829982 /NCGR_PEP_ID=MMETSP1389-20130828/15861_1 /ASSEMBLY_ACC=CAM_ASM_000865 /TAXON_ID=302021 /ORGANISM="Rhodomonas sp., Strain CCMP768" /LENGTH=1038 /DNA_ID=CAMNT_0049503575 /DNA_START=13 /DNA_END=3129 /DNA_ORIENTATION=-